MKQIPMLFSPAMVAALLDDRKLMTRREKFNGSPGDLIWVKEEHYLFGKWVKKGKTKTGKQAWRFVDYTDQYQQRVGYGENPPYKIAKGRPAGYHWFKRSSLFMQKKNARMWLKIALVEYQRLQLISSLDAQLEGIQPLRMSLMQRAEFGEQGYLDYSKKLEMFNEPVSAVKSFRSLWIKINGAASWKANPIVKVISFVKTSKP